MKICPACSREYPADRTHCERDGVGLVALVTGAQGRAEDLIGRTIDGRYLIEGIVGKGGMGTVYACRHVVVGKPFAMKVLRAGMEQTEGVLQRFIREAQTANSIRSRHIVEMTDFGQLPTGQFYVTMELLEGMDLGKALKQGLSREQMFHVFIQCADALEQTHQRGVVHRDLKPDNIFLVTEDGDPLFVKLLDFGIAKAMNAGGPSGLTETGVVLGTPYYMSPEQARGAELDHRTDIYSLGVIMYRAFTGKLPFIADSAVGVLTRHLTERPDPPSRVAGLDPPTEQVILTCLEKRPEDRYPSMRGVADALRHILRANRAGSGAYLAAGSGPYSAAGSGAYPAGASGQYPAGGSGAFPAGGSGQYPGAQSGPYAAAGPASGSFGATRAERPPTASGQYPGAQSPFGSTGPNAAMGGAPSGQYPAGGSPFGSTGPNAAMGGAPSGQYPAGPSGAFPVAAGPSGAFPVAATSGAHAAAALSGQYPGAQSGQVPAAQVSGAYPGAQSGPYAAAGPASVHNAAGPGSVHNGGGAAGVHNGGGGAAGVHNGGGIGENTAAHGLATSQAMKAPKARSTLPIIVVGAVAMLGLGAALALGLKSGGSDEDGKGAAAGPGASVSTGASAASATAVASASGAAEAPSASATATAAASAGGAGEAPSASGEPATGGASGAGAASAAPTPKLTGPKPTAAPTSKPSTTPTTKRPPEIRSPFD